jgi:hypothetical protein
MVISERWEICDRRGSNRLAGEEETSWLDIKSGRTFLEFKTGNILKVSIFFSRKKNVLQKKLKKGDVKIKVFLHYFPVVLQEGPINVIFFSNYVLDHPKNVYYIWNVYQV